MLIDNARLQNHSPLHGPHMGTTTGTERGSMSRSAQVWVWRTNEGLRPTRVRSRCGSRTCTGAVSRYAAVHTNEARSGVC